MYQKITKILALRTSKTELSHWRGCIFQGFQHFKKDDKNHPKMVPKSLLEATWGIQASIQAALRLLEASWNALGDLRDPKKVIGNGSWTARGHRGDWFQLSWGSTMGPGEGSKKGAKTGPRLRTAKP